MYDMLKTELKTIKELMRLFSLGGRIVFLLDEELCCIYSGDRFFLSEGESLRMILGEELRLSENEVTNISCYRNGGFFCASVSPFGNYYFCEITDRRGALDILEKTDLLSEMFPACAAMEHSTGELWRCLNRLRGLLPEQTLVSDMDRALFSLSAVERCFFDYVSMNGVPAVNIAFDLCSLCRRVCARCAEALAKCGRGIEVITEECGLYVRADSRRAVIALVNAIQNALLYSPKDCVPLLTVRHILRGGRSFAEVRIVNEDIMYTDRDFAKACAERFPYRLGFGIPVIERFAELCGGEFAFTRENGAAQAVLILPAAPAAELEGCRLEDDRFAVYDTGAPDLVDIRMREVTELFAEQD